MMHNSHNFSFGSAFGNRLARNRCCYTKYDKMPADVYPTLTKDTLFLKLKLQGHSTLTTNPILFAGFLFTF